MIRLSIVALLTFFILHSCNEKEGDKENTSSVRVKKSSKLVSPTPNQRFVRGNAIDFEYESEGVIDSIQITTDGFNETFSHLSFTIELPNRKVGKWKIKSKVFMNGESENHHRTVIILSENEPQKLTYEVVNSYPHNTEDFTQGLLVHGGFIYESTGQKRESTFKKKEIESGKLINAVNLDNSYFGEGLALLDDKFYQITWKSGIALVYDLDMNEINTFNYTGDGWGLVNYNDQLIMTGGKEEMLFLDPSTFTTQKILEVYDNSGKIDSLNELEIINDKLYANVWLRQDIIEIDLQTGEVLSIIDMRGLLIDANEGDPDNLNGIAYDQENDRIFVTGKYWPKLYEVKFIPKKTL